MISYQLNNYDVPVIIEKSGTTIRVLHVDDDVTFLLVSKEILSSEANMEIDTASSVEDAFKKIQSNTYNAIVSDYEMPQKNGLQFLKEIRHRGIQTPFILFTGKGREEVAVEALNLGADGYVNKQGNPETVYGELAHAIVRSVVLRQVEDRYRMIADNIQDVVTVVDENGILVFVSPSVEKVAGYFPNELIGQRCIGLFHPDDWKKIIVPAVQKLREGQEVPPTEYRVRTKKGSYLWVEGNAHTIIDERGRPKLLVVSRNIEERKNAEEKVWNLAERNYLYLEAGGVGASEYDFQTGTSFWDERARGMLGVKEGATPKFDENLFGINPADRNNLEQAIKQAIAGVNGERYRSEFRVGLPNNSIRWVAAYGQVYFKGEEENRKPSRLLGVYIDVTERKKAEEANKQSYLKISRIIDAIDDAIYVLDRDWNFVYINQRMAKLAGCEPRQMIGKNCWQFYPKWINTICERSLRDAMNKREPKRFSWNGLYSKDIWEVNVFPFEEGIIAIAHAVTKEKIAEEKSLESEQRYRRLFESAIDGIQVSTPDGVIISANKAAAKILGYKSVEEFLGKRVASHYVNPADRQILLEHLKKEGELKDYELKLQRNDGKQIDCLCSIVAQRDSANEIRSIQTILRDITQRKQTEAKLTILNEKLQVVGGLTRHDVRNKLMIANNNAYLLKKKLGNQPEIIKYIEGIESALQQSDRLFEFSRLYEKIGAEKPSEIDVEESFKQAVSLIANPQLTTINACHGLKVIADELLTQLFYNLVDNSIKHGKTVNQIGLRFLAIDKKIVLFYEDNGIGIPQENKEKIFAEGFTTGGSGLGLKLVKKMVEAYGWTIRETGTPGKGAKFEITISTNNSNET